MWLLGDLTTRAVHLEEGTGVPVLGGIPVLLDEVVNVEAYGARVWLGLGSSRGNDVKRRTPLVQSSCNAREG